MPSREIRHPASQWSPGPPATLCCRRGPELQLRGLQQGVAQPAAAAAPRQAPPGPSRPLQRSPPAHNCIHCTVLCRLRAGAGAGPQPAVCRPLSHLFRRHRPACRGRGGHRSGDNSAELARDKAGSTALPLSDTTVKTTSKGGAGQTFQTEKKLL